jgi:hypothetical protein
VSLPPIGSGDWTETGGKEGIIEVSSDRIRSYKSGTTDAINYKCITGEQN